MPGHLLAGSGDVRDQHALPRSFSEVQNRTDHVCGLPVSIKQPFRQQSGEVLRNEVRPANGHMMILSGQFDYDN